MMNILHYLKYFLFHIIGLLALTMVTLGGAYTTYGLITILVFEVAPRNTGHGSSLS